MALHEPIRSSIFHHLEELLGTEEAAAVMDQFPTYDPRDVVTVEMLDLRLRETEARLGGQITREISGLRNEFIGEIAGLRTELTGEIAGLRTELHQTIGAAKHDLYVAFVTTTIGFAGVLVGAGIFITR